MCCVGNAGYLVKRCEFNEAIYLKFTYGNTTIQCIAVSILKKYNREMAITFYS